MTAEQVLCGSGGSGGGGSGAAAAAGDDGCHEARKHIVGGRVEREKAGRRGGGAAVDKDVGEVVGGVLPREAIAKNHALVATAQAGYAEAQQRNSNREGRQNNASYNADLDDLDLAGGLTQTRTEFLRLLDVGHLPPPRIKELMSLVGQYHASVDAHTLSYTYYRAHTLSYTFIIVHIHYHTHLLSCTYTNHTRIILYA
jgi:hypothetical protein